MRRNLQYIDLNYLNDLFNHDKKLINKIIECFINYSPATLQDLMAFRQHHDYDKLDFQLYKYRHQIKVVGIGAAEDLLNKIIQVKKKPSAESTKDIISLLDKVEQISIKAIEESRNLYLERVA